MKHSAARKQSPTKNKRAPKAAGDPPAKVIDFTQTRHSEPDVAPPDRHAHDEKPLDAPARDAVVSDPQHGATQFRVTPFETETQGVPIMDKSVIVFTKSTKPRKGSGILYTADGYKGKTLRLPASFFPEGQIDETLRVEGGFKGPKQPRAKMTKEERAALPKLTTAEKIARAEKRLADLRAKTAREQAATI